MDTLFQSPAREYILIPLLVLALIIDLLAPSAQIVVFVVALAGALPTFLEALRSLRKKKLGIDVFNAFALIASFATLDVKSAIFIVLMLAFARLLEWVTESRTSHAIEALLQLKPSTASIERNGTIETIPIDQVRTGDILIVTTGTRIPVDGVILHGDARVNESSVTGESRLIRKTIGDLVLSSTLNESGAFKMKATRVGADSTIERMVALMQAAELNKSRSEKLADRFAGWFLPVVGFLGLGTYLVTHNLSMTAALFLVACADDMAVAIPLAMTAAIGRAAKQGVIVKGGEWLDALSRVDTIVFDKTGTLTYGNLRIADIHHVDGIDERRVLRLLAAAEKYSEHPVGRAVFQQLSEKISDIPDADETAITAGSGIRARIGKDIVVVGSERIFDEQHIAIPADIRTLLTDARERHGRTVFLVAINGSFAAVVSVSDIPRPEAAQSIAALRDIGVAHISMLTGDNSNVASATGKLLGISDIRASMTPEQKLRALEDFEREGKTVAMIGDGINDAPALARAHVGIAMGSAGTATTVEAANIVILSDDLSRLPTIITLGRQTVSIIRMDVVIWVISNLCGFALVFTGIAGPVLAAFYNFATDFLPLINSSRLFFTASHKKELR